MILSGIACFAGVMAGILSFTHFSAFERFSRSFAASILFFISSKSHAGNFSVCFLLNCIFFYIPFNCIKFSLCFFSIYSSVYLFYSAIFALLAMAIYTGVTLSFLGKRFGDWRFSWSYILGWVAMLMTFFAGERTQSHTT